MRSSWRRSGHIPSRRHRPSSKMYSPSSFEGDKAMAAVMVTRTLPTGAVVARPETHFYVLTAKGWQRTRPQAEFWGPTETLDTASLHFVFGSTDRAVVEQMAQSAEALYATLRRATGEDLATEGLLTVELVPDELVNDRPASCWMSSGWGRRRLPIAACRCSEATSSSCCSCGTRSPEGCSTAAVQKSTPQAQWSTMVEAFGDWLQFSSVGRPSPPSELATLQRLGRRRRQCATPGGPARP